MIADKMKKLVENDLAMQQMLEGGRELVKQYGKDNVYDFSIGNPSVEPPKEVNEAIKKCIQIEDIHAYTSCTGYEEVRKKIANSLNERFDTDFNETNIAMCVGAAGGLNVVLKSILNKDEEVIVFVPYFMEYRGYIENYNGKIIEVACNENFAPNMKDFESKINEKTKAVTINNPNNPSGVVYSEETLTKIVDILRKKEKEYNKAIYLISDEPYREIVFDGIKIPYLTKYYDDTIVVYSYSKSLSIPGERIGYITIPTQVDDFENLIQAVAISTRVLGFVNAPSLLQKVVEECNDITADMKIYEKNRDILYEGLKEAGYECTKPQGTFYLFLKSPIEDEKEFCNIAKRHNILVVPGSSFSCKGYVRIAFCTETKKIENAIPKFKEVMEEIKGK